MLRMKRKERRERKEDTCMDLLSALCDLGALCVKNLVVFALCCTVIGCATTSSLPPQLSRDVNLGNYDKPRDYLQRRVDEHGELWRSRLDRSEILDRYRLGVVALAEGDVQAAERALRETFELLASHGINRRKQLAATIINEDQKIWKGEPFEQAMACLRHDGLMG